MKNTIKAILFLILALVTVSFVSSAVIDFGIKSVEFDGVVVNPNDASTNLNIERGTTLPVTVIVQGSANGKIAYDTRVRVELGGYEYSTVEAVSDIFEVAPNNTYKKTLRLKLPSDMEASKKYNITVEVYDGTQHIVQNYPLTVKETRHLLNIYDVILNPFSNVQAGQPFFVTVRVENMGDNVEDSIRVTASMPQLGIQTSEFVDQLIRAADKDQYNNIYSKNDAATTNQLMLVIPEDAKEGDYTLEVKLNYNRGYGNTFESDAGDVKTYKVHVKGTKETTAVASSVLVNVDNMNQKATAGQGSVYKVSVANLGKEAQTYTVEVLGVGSFGTSRVDPQAVIVAADKQADVNVYVSPAENVEGLKSFTVKVKDAAGNVLSEKALTLDVVKTQVVGFESFKKVLEFGFVALLIILVILGIVLVAKRLGGKEEATEGQTYYQ